MCLGGILLCMSVLSMLLSGCSSSSVASTTTTTPIFTEPTAIPSTTTTTTETANAVVSAVPSLSTVSPGSNFDVSIEVTTSAPTRSCQVELNWDPTKVTCNSVDQGTFFTSFAQQNNVTASLMPSTLSVDNTIGKFPPGNDIQGTIQYAETAFLMGGSPEADGTYPGVEGTGVVFILHMTALPNASGTVNFTLSDVGMAGNQNPSNALNPTVRNGQITISGSS
jgi:hypothetical protein